MSTTSTLTVTLPSSVETVVSTSVIVISQATSTFFSPFYTSDDGSSAFDGVQEWETNSQQKIVWQTLYTSYTLDLYHLLLDASGGSEVHAATVNIYDGNGRGTISYNWSVKTYDTNVAVSPLYFFRVNSGPDMFASPYFNITLPSVSASTTTTTSSTSSGAISDNTIPVDISSPSSKYLQIGLGVGLGIGIPLLLLMGALVGIYLVRQRRHTCRSGTEEKDRAPQGSQQPRKSNNQTSDQQYYSTSQPFLAAFGLETSGPYEVDGQPPIVEAPSHDISSKLMTCLPKDD